VGWAVSAGAVTEASWNAAFERYPIVNGNIFGFDDKSFARPQFQGLYPVPLKVVSEPILVHIHRNLFYLAAHRVFLFSRWLCLTQTL
jgi:hypothetical protein